MGLNIKAHLNSTIEKQTYDFISPVEEDSSLYGHSKKNIHKKKVSKSIFLQFALLLLLKRN